MTVIFVQEGKIFQIRPFRALKAATNTLKLRQEKCVTMAIATIKEFQLLRSECMLQQTKVRSPGALQMFWITFARISDPAAH